MKTETIQNVIWYLLVYGYSFISLLFILTFSGFNLIGLIATFAWLYSSYGLLSMDMNKKPLIKYD